MQGIIIAIDGDYAVVRYESGTESHVALAMLDGADVGDQVKFEDFEYTLIKK